MAVFSSAKCITGIQATYATARKDGKATTRTLGRASGTRSALTLAAGQSIVSTDFRAGADCLEAVTLVTNTSACLSAGTSAARVQKVSAPGGAVLQSLRGLFGGSCKGPAVQAVWSKKPAAATVGTAYPMGSNGCANTGVCAAARSCLIEQGSWQADNPLVHAQLMAPGLWGARREMPRPLPLAACCRRHARMCSRPQPTRRRPAARRAPAPHAGAKACVVSPPSAPFGTTTPELARERNNHVIIGTFDGKTVFEQDGWLRKICAHSGSWCAPEPRAGAIATPAHVRRTRTHMRARTSTQRHAPACRADAAPTRDPLRPASEPTPRDRWSPGLTLQYGGAPEVALGNTGYSASCITLDEDERITTLAIRSGWWVDEYVISTNKNPEPRRIGGWDGVVPDVFVALPEPGTYVAGFSVTTDNNADAGASDIKVMGLVVHWAKDC